MVAVAVIGSSGGGAATLGHTNPEDLLRGIAGELRKVRRRDVPNKNPHTKLISGGPARSSGGGDATQHPRPAIIHALFLSLHGGAGLDAADPETTMATLYAIGCEEAGNDDGTHDSGDDDDGAAAPVRIRTVASGPLRTVNRAYRRLDSEHVVPAIASGRVDGLILISSDPGGVNEASVSAAAKAGIPCTGSGGTSVGKAAAAGARLVGNAGGSVATTSYTRAVSYVYALSEAWGCDYDPLSAGSDGDEVSVKPHIRSVLDSCVPAFVSVCVTCRLMKVLVANLSKLGGFNEIGVIESQMNDEDSASFVGIAAYANHLFQFVLDQTSVNQFSSLTDALQHYALPTVTCVVAASAYAPEHGSIAIMAAGIASAGCGGSILAGLFAGWGVAMAVGRTLFFCIRNNVPATMTNVVVAGGVGAAMAFVMQICGATAAMAAATRLIRSLVRLSVFPLEIGGKIVTAPPPGLGFLFGCLFCYGSKIGWYHSFFLPVILVEMERGEASIWGAVDECTLVLVSAGICAANILAWRLCLLRSGLTHSEYEVSCRGLRINLLCGDFIEAAYPFMERSKVVNGFAYLASGMATEILYRMKPSAVLGSAYLPVIFSVYLADDWGKAALACLTAFGVAFCGGIIWNVNLSRTFTENEETKKRKKH